MDSLLKRRNLFNEQYRLFDRLMDLPTDLERDELLEKIGDENPVMKNQLEQLLSLQDSPDLAAFEDTNTYGAGPDGESPNVLPKGRYVDQYKILEMIGEGGMGQVYMAEQVTPVRRRVALKLIRGNRNSQKIITRFKAERQALYRLDHPGVARILDAGETPDGQNFFVMELINGSSLIDYCDRNQLSVAERLVLFENVCRAIHHAHQKGIIHRDIKPSNVLVTHKDGEATIKVIDFGIAKALDEPLVDQTLVTRFGELIGTPNYMSPEQLEHGASDLDTRTDIYSLGVLLYELLTGKLPHEFHANQGFVARLRELRESEPVRPSMKITQSMERELETVEDIAKKRRSSTAGLLRFLRGDLDWIILKALSKARAERYESADAFANDIRRFLSNEPVEAVAPSLAYRVSKSFQKHRAICVFGALALGALILLTGFSIYWAISSIRAREKFERQSAVLKDEIAKSKRLEARAISAEKQARHHARNKQNEAIKERALTKFLMKSSVGSLPKFETLFVTAEFHGDRMERRNDQMVAVTQGCGETDAIHLGGPVILGMNRLTDEEFQRVFEDAAGVNREVEFTFATAPGTSMNGEFPSRDGSPGSNDASAINSQRLLALKTILAEQEKEFGPDDEFVGQTLISIALVHLDLCEPLKGQLAIHEALNKIEDPHLVKRCERIMVRLKQMENEDGSKPNHFLSTQIGAENRVKNVITSFGPRTTIVPKIKVHSASDCDNNQKDCDPIRAQTQEHN